MDQPTRRQVMHVAAFTAAVVAVDLTTKTLTADTPQQIPGVEPVTNPGFLLGVANPTTMIVIAMSAAGLIVFGGWCVHRTITRRLPTWPTGLLLGGAIANLLDRLLYSSVRDFIATPWVIFNLADVALVIGVAVFFSYSRGHSPHQPDPLPGVH